MCVCVCVCVCVRAEESVFVSDGVYVCAKRGFSDEYVCLWVGRGVEGGGGEWGGGVL